MSAVGNTVNAGVVFEACACYTVVDLLDTKRRHGRTPLCSYSHLPSPARIFINGRSASNKPIREWCKAQVATFSNHLSSERAKEKPDVWSVLLYRRPPPLINLAPSPTARTRRAFRLLIVRNKRFQGKPSGFEITPLWPGSRPGWFTAMISMGAIKVSRPSVLQQAQPPDTDPCFTISSPGWRLECSARFSAERRFRGFNGQSAVLKRPSRCLATLRLTKRMAEIAEDEG
ncbi:hypothetical protein QBC42DRAFT_248099 [Cladorrhinum samala]|uniref:Uncharacterized protein n=1 Tax=Cladorrhinum samala TaxID=585594 RepID=A0AAV9HZ26_9PEZI|nr:hypothetical protein QBC42DRAFT_248099 [Cladorrhinum samala]